MPNAKMLADFDFDENKVNSIVALSISSYLVIVAMVVFVFD